MRILLPTDVFPPKCGGAGWSSHALALALIGRGHDVTAIVPQLGADGMKRETVLGVPTVRVGYRAPNIPFVKNYARHERFWPIFADAIVAEYVASEPTIIHAQHVQASSAAVLAGKQVGVPVVVTIRDHWPWDYFATGLHGNMLPYANQQWAGLATDLVAREGPLRGTLAMAAIPYIRSHTERRLGLLRQADAVIAVSSYIARRLEPLIAPERIHVLPNMVDLAAIDAVVASPPQSTDVPYMLYVGKLDRNKGAHLLGDIFRAYRALPAAPTSPELVIAGDGPLRPMLAQELAALHVPVRWLDWAEHDEVLRLMAHCEVLLFPSIWGEPLSRVWLEAAACGAPMVAMPTGGIRDIIADGDNGLLAATPELFASKLAGLLGDASLRQQLGNAAQQKARERFSVEHVIESMEALYSSLVHVSQLARRLST